MGAKLKVNWVVEAGFEGGELGGESGRSSNPCDCVEAVVWEGEEMLKPWKKLWAEKAETGLGGEEEEGWAGSEERKEAAEEGFGGEEGGESNRSSEKDGGWKQTPSHLAQSVEQKGEGRAAGFEHPIEQAQVAVALISFAALCLCLCLSHRLTNTALSREWREGDGVVS